MFREESRRGAVATDSYQKGIAGGACAYPASLVSQEGDLRSSAMTDDLL